MVTDEEKVRVIEQSYDRFILETERITKEYREKIKLLLKDIDEAKLALIRDRLKQQ